MTLTEAYSFLSDMSGQLARMGAKIRALAQAAQVYPAGSPDRVRVEKLITDGSKTYNQLSSVRDAINAAKAQGLSLLAWLRNLFSPALGIVPLVPVAITFATITAAIAAAVSFSKSADVELAKAKVAEEMVARGLDPTKMLQKPSGFLSNLGTLAIIGGVVLAVVFLLPRQRA